MKIINLEQGSPEWISFRKLHVGASEAPIILGVSPWDSPYGLWRKKLDLDPPQEMNNAMRRGVENEHIAREFSETLYGCNLCPIVAQSEEYPWLIASFDAYSLDFDVAIEIKCPGEKDHDLARKGLVPEKYIPQLYQQMIVANLDRITYQSHRNDENIYVDICRDNIELEKELIEKTKAFYDCVMTLTQPELCDRDYVDMSQNNEFMLAADEYKTIKVKKKFIEEQEALCREKLISLCGQSNAKGNGLSLCKVVSKGRVDWSLAQKTIGFDSEPFRKQPTESWRIT